MLVWTEIVRPGNRVEMDLVHPGGTVAGVLGGKGLGGQVCGVFVARADVESAVLGDGKDCGVGTVAQLAALVVEGADVDCKPGHAEEHDHGDGDEDPDRATLGAQPLHLITAVASRSRVWAPKNGMSI